MHPYTCMILLMFFLRNLYVESTFVESTIFMYMYIYVSFI